MSKRKMLLAGVIAASVMLVGCNDVISISPEAIELVEPVCDTNDGVFKYTIEETSTYNYVSVTCLNNANFNRVAFYNSSNEPAYAPVYKYLADKKQE